MHTQATAQKTSSVYSNYNRFANKSRPKQSYMRAYYQNKSRYALRKSQSRDEHQQFASYHLGEIIDQLCKSGALA